MNTAQDLPVGKRLTFRILVTTLLGLAFTLLAIGYTLLLSWQLEGGAAAINEAGSLRVRSYRLAVVIEHVSSTSAEEELAQFNSTLNNLQMGDAKRPLFLPTTKPIREQMLAVQNDWVHGLHPIGHFIKALRQHAKFIFTLHRQTHTQIVFGHTGYASLHACDWANDPQIQ